VKRYQAVRIDKDVKTFPEHATVLRYMYDAYLFSCIDPFIACKFPFSGSSSVTNGTVSETGRQWLWVEFIPPDSHHHKTDYEGGRRIVRWTEEKFDWYGSGKASC
jgi:hypothetical protein